MLVHVLLYSPGTDNEGIHSIELNGQTIVLMFEENDDAERYCGLLEAQDFPKPSIEKIDKDEIEQFCLQAGYESRLVTKGFRPQTQEERLLISPPPRNIDSIINDPVKDQKLESHYSKPNNSEEINSFRQSLEDLI